MNKFLSQLTPIEKSQITLLSNFMERSSAELIYVCKTI